MNEENEKERHTEKENTVRRGYEKWISWVVLVMMKERREVSLVFSFDSCIFNFSEFYVQPFSSTTSLLYSIITAKREGKERLSWKQEKSKIEWRNERREFLLWQNNSRTERQKRRSVEYRIQSSEEMKSCRLSKERRGRLVVFLNLNSVVKQELHSKERSKIAKRVGNKCNPFNQRNLSSLSSFTAVLSLVSCLFCHQKESPLLFSKLLIVVFLFLVFRSTCPLFYPSKKTMFCCYQRINLFFLFFVVFRFVCLLFFAKEFLLLKKTLEDSSSCFPFPRLFFFEVIIIVLSLSSSCFLSVASFLYSSLYSRIASLYLFGLFLILFVFEEEAASFS